MTVGDVGGAALKKGMKGAGILRRFASMAYKEKGAMNYMRRYRRQSMDVYRQVPGLGLWTTYLLNDLHSNALHRFIEASPQYNFRNHPGMVLKKDEKKRMA